MKTQYNKTIIPINLPNIAKISQTQYQTYDTSSTYNKKGSKTQQAHIKILKYNRNISKKKTTTTGIAFINN